MRKKLQHFAENATSPLVIEEGKAEFLHTKGRWGEIFGNTNPIVLELGCGKGAYTIGLAKTHPEWNVIGMDRKGDRIWYGMKETEALGLQNVRFFRGPIGLIERFFAPGEVHEIWITFPDPHPLERAERQRMTGPRFLRNYAALLREGGIIHLKTDSQALHEFTKQAIKKEGSFRLEEAYTDIRNFPKESILQTIQTAYEKRFRGEGLPITYLRARKRGSLGRIWARLTRFFRT